jgi:hypothetical protein
MRQWWRRNWAWFLPTSTLVIGSLALVLTFLGLIAFVVVSALGTLRSSSACTAAIGRAASDPAVLEAVGVPIERGWLVSGTLDPGRCAELTIPISGPRGSATIHIKASCAHCRLAIWPFVQEPPEAAKEWAISALTAEVGTARRQITVIEDPTPAISACNGRGLKRGSGW